MQHLTEADFSSEIGRTKLPAVVMFYARWCGKCAMMKPVVEDIEDRYRRRIRFYEADAEESAALAARYGADIYPTFVFFENGKPLAALQGVVRESVYEQCLNKIFRNI